MFGAGRWFLRRAVAKGLVEAPAPVRWGTTRPSRRQLEVVRPARDTELPLRNHILAGVVFATMILVGVGIVTAVPLAFVWVASQLSATTAPGTRPYLIVAIGTALGAAVGLRLLATLHGWHSELTGWRNSARRPASWNRSVGDTEWVREPGAVVEWIVVFIVLAAAAALLLWIFAFADPAKLVPQELQPT
jgi:MFS family permease